MFKKFQTLPWSTLKNWHTKFKAANGGGIRENDGGAFYKSLGGNRFQIFLVESVVEALSDQSFFKGYEYELPLFVGTDGLPQVGINE